MRLCSRCLLEDQQRLGLLLLAAGTLLAGIAWKLPWGASTRRRSGILPHRVIIARATQRGV